MSSAENSCSRVDLLGAFRRLLGVAAEGLSSSGAGHDIGGASLSYYGVSYRLVQRHELFTPSWRRVRRQSPHGPWKDQG